MKCNVTIFTCDECGKKAEIDSNGGYPYDRGWCYIYEFNGKSNRGFPILGEKDGIVFMKFNDKHFCSPFCMLEYLRVSIEVATEMPIEVTAKSKSSRKKSKKKRRVVHDEQGNA